MRRDFGEGDQDASPKADFVGKEVVAAMPEKHVGSRWFIVDSGVVGTVFKRNSFQAKREAPKGRRSVTVTCHDITKYGQQTLKVRMNSCPVSLDQWYRSRRLAECSLGEFRGGPG